MSAPAPSTEGPCPICGGVPFAADPDWSRKGATVLGCPNCRARRPDPLPSAQELERFYSGPGYTEGTYVTLPGLAERRARWFDHQLAVAETLGTDIRRMLDVGASRGTALRAGLRRGWSVEGLEPDRTAAEAVARSLGVPVHVGSAPEGLRGLGEYDLVLLTHVLEHVLDPVALVREIARHVRPGGLLMVRTPNASSPMARFGRQNWAWFCPPIHLWYFENATLDHLAASEQFARVRIATARGDAHAPLIEWAIVVAKGARRRSSSPTVPAPATGAPRFGAALSIALQLADTALAGSPERGSDELFEFWRRAPDRRAG